VSEPLHCHYFPAENYLRFQIVKVFQTTNLTSKFFRYTNMMAVRHLFLYMQQRRGLFLIETAVFAVGEGTNRPRGQGVSPHNASKKGQPMIFRNGVTLQWH
jgi:hypothetical protein